MCYSEGLPDAVEQRVETKKGRSLSIGKPQQSVSDLAQNIPIFGMAISDGSAIANVELFLPQCRYGQKRLRQ